MRAVDTFIARAIRWFLIVFGVATCMTLPFAIDVNLLTPMLDGAVDYTSSSLPALRHWGIMVFGIGALMLVAGSCPWLRFENVVQHGRKGLYGLFSHEQSQPAWGKGLAFAVPDRLDDRRVQRPVLH